MVPQIFLIGLVQGSPRLKQSILWRGITQPVHKSEGRLCQAVCWLPTVLLDVVVRERAAVLQLLTGEDQTLLVRRDPFLVLDLCLRWHHVASVCRRSNSIGWQRVSYCNLAKHLPNTSPSRFGSRPTCSDAVVSESTFKHELTKPRTFLYGIRTRTLTGIPPELTSTHSIHSSQVHPQHPLGR